jgi:hypothetical protein
LSKKNVFQQNIHDNKKGRKKKLTVVEEEIVVKKRVPSVPQTLNQFPICDDLISCFQEEVVVYPKGDLKDSVIFLTVSFIGLTPVTILQYIQV